MNNTFPNGTKTQFQFIVFQIYKRIWNCLSSLLEVMSVMSVLQWAGVLNKASCLHSWYAKKQLEDLCSLKENITAHVSFVQK